MENTPAYKLVRTVDPDTSHDAAYSLNVNRLERIILTDIENSGQNGLTQDDLLMMHPEMSYSSVTARPAALKEKGLIFDSGERRVGRSGKSQAVLKAIAFRSKDN